MQIGNVGEDELNANVTVYEEIADDYYASEESVKDVVRID